MPRLSRAGALLAGLRIADLTRANDGFCAKLLADLGAQVERVDVAIPADRRRFSQLVRSIDAIVEDLPPGSAPQHGIPLDEYRAADPRLVVVSITPFGQTGPRRLHASCDLVQAAVGGQMYVSGPADGAPLCMHGEQTKVAASLYAAIGLLLALTRRRASGRGSHVDIATQEAVASMLDHVLVRYLHEGIVAARQGSLSWNRLSFLVRCRDGYLQVHVGTQWDALVEWLDSEGMAADLGDAAWRDERHRHEHAGHVADVIGRWAAGYGVEELFHAAQLRRFPWAPVLAPEDVPGSEQLRARGFFGHDAGAADTDERTDADARVPGPPYRIVMRAEASTAKADDVRSAGVLPLSDARLPLQGVRVLDFSWVLSGPYATRLLGDFGAEVIKVQSAKTAKGAESPDSPWFATWNRNKRSITLDMGRKEAVAIALRLACVSDIVVENFSPRVFMNWGLGHEALARANPAIVTIGISAMGRTGPWKDYVAFGPAFHALSGLTHASVAPSGEPMGPGYAYADHVIGLYAALAALAALEARARTGRGSFVDLSGYEAACTVMGGAWRNRSDSKNDEAGAEPSGCYRCIGDDRWCVVSVFGEAQWRVLCRITGHEHWLRDEAFSSARARVANRARLDAEFGAWTAQRTAEEIVARLQDAGIAAGVVQSAEDLVGDPQLAARGFFVPLGHPVLGARLADRPAIRFADDVQPALPPSWRAAPSLGEANEYVLGELLGMSRRELSRLRRDGVLY